MRVATDVQFALAADPAGASAFAPQLREALRHHAACVVQHSAPQRGGAAAAAAGGAVDERTLRAVVAALSACGQVRALLNSAFN